MRADLRRCGLHGERRVREESRGCDGFRPGRNYYTDFVKAAPKDTVILTLACGKYRFNDKAILG